MYRPNLSGSVAFTLRHFVAQNPVLLVDICRLIIRFFIRWMIWVRHFRYLKAGPEFDWFQLIYELRGATRAVSNTPKYFS